MKKGYKGFDENLSCMGLAYHFDTVYNKPYAYDNTRFPKLCTNEGYHYCKTLDKVFEWYDNDGLNRFCEIEILGVCTETEDKCITTSFRIIRELSRKEILECISKKNKVEMSKKLNLSTLKSLQTEFPLSHIGGSTGLFLHGAQLKRWTKNTSDFDIIIPFYTPLSENADIVELHKSGNDFDYVFKFADIKVDCKVDPVQKYSIIEHEGFKYKVTSLDTILKAKIKYALNNQSKHIEDIAELIENKFLTPQKYLKLVQSVVGYKK